ncbi:unnamed protein product [Urochloa humidicola]
MKPPAASPGRAEKPQLPAPAPPGLARLLLSKSRRGGRSRRAPATSPMFVSRGRSRAADGEPSSPKVTCIGQVRMRKGKKGKKGAASKAAAAPEKGGAKGYCRCLKKAFLCGGLFEFDSRKRRQKAPSPEVERARRSPWVFSSRDVAVAAAPKAAADPRSGSKGEMRGDEEEEEEMVVGIGVFGSIGREEGEKMMGIGGGDGEKEDDEEKEREAQLVSSATTTPPKNALLLMRCRSAPQNRTSPLTSRFLPATAAPAAVHSPTRDALVAASALEIAASPSPSPSPRKPEKASPSPRKLSTEKVLADECGGEIEKRQEGAAATPELGPQLMGGQQEEEYDDEFEEEDDEMRCSSARPLVLQRCKSEPATTAAAKMAAGGGPGADATTAGCFWAHGGSSGRRRHAPPPPAAGAPVALTGH